MSKSIAENTKSNAVCPHCALLCDDLMVQQNSDLSLRVVKNGCQRADIDYARPPSPAIALVRGRAVTLAVAISTAAEMLKRARQPLLGGLATDVDGMRALVDLAEQCGATLDHMHGDSLNAMSRLLQTRGWYATTLSEVRNRADLVVIIDADLDHTYANFSRRCLTPVIQFQRGKKRPRQVVYVGRRQHQPTRSTLDGSLLCRRDKLHDTLLALLAALRGHATASSRAPGVKALALAMRAAKYCAVVFAPATLGPHRDPVIATLCDIVDEINRASRAAMLALGGDDGGQSAVSCASWLTGYPLRTTFGRELRYEPHINRTQTLLANRTADALLWIDAFGRTSNPPAAAVASETIVLAASAPKSVADFAVYIAVGTPGVDHFARLVRTDTVVTLALPKQRECALPSVADVITKIINSR